MNFNGVNSEHSFISCGVPQGSVLGPLLFLIYINDIANVSQKLYMLLFADDTSALVSGNNLVDLQNIVNNDLANVVKWLNSNKLSLNVNKSNFILFSNKKVEHELNIILDGKSLERVESTKFLGVIVDERLSWKQHIKYVKSKVSKAIGIITLCRKYFNCSTLVNLYYAFVYPLLTYNIEVWGSAAQIHLSYLLKLQKRGVRIMTNSPSRAHTKDLFKRLEILPLPKLYEMKLLLFLYKYRNSDLPVVFNNFFILNNSIHNYITRHRHCFRTPRVRTDIRNRTLRCAAVRVYNTYYNVIDYSVRISIFKQNVKKMLLNSLLI